MKKDKITLLAVYQVKEGAMPALIEAFEAMVRYTRQEPGNLRYEAFLSREDPGRFFIYEEYDSREALAAHRDAPYFKSIIPAQILPMLENRQVHELLPLYQP